MFDPQQYNREYHIKNKEKRNAQSRAYHRENLERHRAFSMEWRINNPGKARESGRKSSIKHKEKKLAKAAIYRATKTGQIIKPNKCSSCGAIGLIEAHHHLGYAKENWLDVKWLCPPCHGKAHRVYL